MSNITVGSNALVWGAVITLAAAGLAGFTFLGKSRSSKVVTESFAQPLNGQKRARVEINTGTGHLTIAGLERGKSDLASGEIQYLDNQTRPLESLETVDGRVVFTLKDSSTPSGFRFPWEACKVATEWKVNLNPAVAIDLDAYSGGGNVNFDLSTLTLTGLKVDSGGGNMDVSMPEHSEALNSLVRTGGGNVTVRLGDSFNGSSVLEARSGAGNVAVVLPANVEARITASSGAGKVTVDPRFVKVGDKTYQSAGYEQAVDKIEITAASGAGNVTVTVK